MHLNMIRACVNAEKLNGLTFTLKSSIDTQVDINDQAIVDPNTNPVTENLATLFELESLGYRYGSDCKDVEVPADSFVNFFEVAYDKTSLQITSAFVNFAPLNPTSGEQGPIKGNIALFGQKGSEDLAKEWFFN